jgi:hypothetical protein
MAKKKPTSRTDAVRQAVDQAFQAQIPRERISELLDELGNTAGRLRGAVDELRPASAEEVKTLRSDLRALAERVAALEAAGRAKPKPPPKPAPRRPAAKPAASAKPAAKPAPEAADPAAAAPEPSDGSGAAPEPAAKPRRRAPAKSKPSGEGA